MRKIIFGILFLALLSLGAVFVWQPLLFVDFKNYASMIWLDGYVYKSHKDMAYFRKDICEVDKPCVCVFMVHGIGDQAVTWRKVLTQQKKISTPTKMVAVDLPGAGASLPLEKTEDYQVKLLAERLHEIVEHTCGSDQVILLGNSFGGWITSWMIEQKPERYSRNLLLNPAGLDMPYDRVIEGLIDPSPEKIMVTYRLSHNFGNKVHNLPWFVARHASARMRYFPVEDMIKAQQFGNQFMDSIAQKISTKTKLLWGLQDEFLGKKHLLKYQALFMNDNVIALENCAHVPQDQCPDQVVDVLQALSANIKSLN